MKEFFIPEYLTINGGKPTDGVVNISGAKNEILGAMAAAVLTDQPVELRNVPFISDVLDMGHIMTALGVDVKYSPDTRVLKLHAKKITRNVLPDLALKFRASYYLWGALLARFFVTKEFDSLRIKMPGGCGLVDTFKTGDGFGKKGRASDFHFNLLQNVFDVDIRVVGDDEYEFVLPSACASLRRDNSPLDDDYPIYATRLVSHGATMHWMLAVATSPRQKFMYNAMFEPEIPHLLSILNKMGANLRGTNTTAIGHLGRAGPSSRGAAETGGGLLRGGVFDIMPDRMETGAYALLAAATRGKIFLENTDPEICRPWLNMLIETVKPASRRMCIDKNSIYFDFTGVDVRGVNFICSPGLGKETDMQQIWMATLATAVSPSMVADPIWPDRSNMPEFVEFGVKMDVRQVAIDNFEMPRSSIANIRPSKLHAANVVGMNLRGTFALCVLAAAAHGVSRINKPYFALRGYPNMVENMRGLGIDIGASDGGETLPALPVL